MHRGAGGERKQLAFFLAVHPVSETALRLWSHAGLAGMRQADFACALTESFVTASRLSCKNLD